MFPDKYAKTVDPAAKHAKNLRRLVCHRHWTEATSWKGDPAEPWLGYKRTDWGLFQEGLGIQAGSMRHQQLSHMHLKQQRQQQQNDKNVFTSFISFLLPVSASVPDPSTPRRAAPAIRQNLAGPCELRSPAAARWPGRSRWLLQCGAETTKKTAITFIY